MDRHREKYIAEELAKLRGEKPSAQQAEETVRAVFYFYLFSSPQVDPEASLYKTPAELKARDLLD